MNLLKMDKLLKNLLNLNKIKLISKANLRKKWKKGKSLMGIKLRSVIHKANCNTVKLEKVQINFIAFTHQKVL